MKALKFIKKAKDGKVIIDIPKNLDGKNLNIIITEVISEKMEYDAESLKNNRVAEIMKYYGTAKFPDIDLEKYNVYEQ